MNIEEEIDKDLTLDLTDLAGESRNTQNLVWKWNRRLKIKRLELAKLEQQRKIVEKNQFLFYIGKHPTAVCDTVYEKSELKIVMQGDTKLLKVDAHITIVKVECGMLEDAVKCFIARGFSIKNAIDSKKLDLGIL